MSLLSRRRCGLLAGPGHGEAQAPRPPGTGRDRGRRCRVGGGARAPGAVRSLAAPGALPQLSRLPCGRPESQPLALAPASRLHRVPRWRRRESRGLDASRGSSTEQSPLHPSAPRRGGDACARRRFHAPMQRLPRRSGELIPCGFRPAVVENCLDCHGITTAHLERAGLGVRVLSPAAGASGAAHPGERREVSRPLVASRAGLLVDRPREARAGRRSACRRLLRHVPCPRVLHRMPRERSGGAQPSRRWALTRGRWRSRRSSRRRRTTPNRLSSSSTGAR